ncbi:MAG: Uma2 family endonuclease [Planctomycetaceae bacterium]
MSQTLLEEFTGVTSAVLAPLTVEQYHAMIRAGILPEGAPIELIDGLLIRKDRRDKGGSIMTVGPRHSMVLLESAEVLRTLLKGVNVHVREQQPITLNDIQEPEPDVAVALGKASSYADQHPGPGDVPLVIEVADSSLAFDRRDKLQKYAAAGIPMYWIVNLNDDVIEVYSLPQPQLATYQDRSDYRPGDTISVVIAGTTVNIPAADVLV